MGMRGFVNFMKKHFPGAFYTPDKKIFIDELYVDMNAAAHSLARQKIPGISGEELSRLAKAFNKESVEASQRHLPLNVSQIKALSSIPFFQHIYHKIFSITRHFQPRKHIFFAIDGVAPIAKWPLQKARRKKYADKPNKLNDFQAGILTPGSSLMAYLERSIFWASQDLLLERACLRGQSKYSSPSILIDSASRPGESEWKLCQYFQESLNSQASKTVGGEKSDLARVVCTSDSDVILMCLAAPVRSLFAVDVFNLGPRSCALFSPSCVIEKYLKKIDPVNYFSLRDSLILLALLCGNDCLPKIFKCNIEPLWKSYVEWTKDRDGSFMFIKKDPLCINVSSLQSFLSFYRENLSQFSVDPGDDKETLSPHSDGPEGDRKTDDLVGNEHCEWPADGCIEEYLSSLLKNFYLLFTGGCLNFSERKLRGGPTIEQLVAWDYIGNGRREEWFPLSTATGSQTSGILSPAVSSLALIPPSDDSRPYIAGPLRKFFTEEEDSGVDLFLKFREMSQSITSVPLSEFTPFEAEFSLPSSQASILSLTWKEDQSLRSKFDSILSESTRPGTSSAPFHSAPQNGSPASSLENIAFVMNVNGRTPCGMHLLPGNGSLDDLEKSLLNLPPLIKESLQDRFYIGHIDDSVRAIENNSTPTDCQKRLSLHPLD